MHDIVRGVLLGQPGCAALREAGICSLGIDWRVQGSVWGEGLSPTLLLFLVLEGQVRHEMHCVVAHAGELLLVPPDVPKRLMTPDGPCRAVYVHLSLSNAWRFCSENLMAIAAVTPTRMEAVVEALIAETVSEAPEAQAVVRQWSDLLLLYMQRQLGETTSGEAAARQRLDALWDAVKMQLGEAWTVRRLAKMVHLSEGHFHRQVLHLYHRRPMQIVRRLRLERASDLLRTTNLTVDAVADRVGYGTGFSLSNALARETGKRPRELRRRGRSSDG